MLTLFLKFSKKYISNLPSNIILSQYLHEFTVKNDTWSTLICLDLINYPPPFLSEDRNPKFTIFETISNCNL